MTLSLINLVVTLAAALTSSEAHLNLASTGECGEIPRGSRRLFARVIGGSPADITDFPHAVSLQQYGEHFCAGTLISDEWVLTAAHCVYKVETDAWTVMVGTQNSVNDFEQRVGVEEIILQPDYVYPKYVNDLALLRLSQPVKWSNKAKPSCLPDLNSRTGRALGYLPGWGYDQERRKGGKPTEDLYMARLPILENSVCQEWMSSKNRRMSLQPEHLCAGYEEGMQDGCASDSGGGLVVIDEQKKWMLVGVMSAGFGCGREKLPGIYTRVEKFMPWIKRTIEQHY